MKKILSIIFTLGFFNSSIFSQQESTVIVSLGGNTFITPINAKSIILNDEGITNWSNVNATATAYVRFAKTGAINIKITTAENNSQSSFILKVASKKFLVKASISNTAISVGSVQIKDTGYVAFELIPQNIHGVAGFKNIVISGDAVDSNTVYVKNNDGNMFYWGRRGPSVHLNYTLPKDKNIEWFYNEVTVPVGSDPVGSYFMSNGFGEGYFGMQVNSAIERRILFSVWSPFTTDDPKAIPESDKIKLIKKGDNVHAGAFGGEGSGGQSYMQYNWHAGTTYKFLTHVIPVDDSLTQYTSYFFATEENKWLLVASFVRPHTHTYYTHAHSFLENFEDAMGTYNRKVYFNNEWIRDTDGNWIELTKAKFTTDATGKIGARKDYKGGIEKGNFKLSNGGFFADYTTPNTIFERDTNNIPPVVDFKNLP
jgi:hypothetical protein